MRLRTLVLASVAVAAGAALVFAAVSSAAPAPGAREGAETPDAVKRVPANVPPEYQVTVTPEMQRHSRINNALYFIGTLWGIGVLFVILATGWSRRMRDLAQRMVRKRFLAAMLYIAFFSGVSTLLSLPLNLYAGWIVPQQFGLSNQTLAQWVLEGVKGFGVALVIGAPLGALALQVIRRLRRGWWLALWAGSIPIAIFLVVIAPVIIEPLFNHFEPLKNPKLRAELLAEAQRAGIPSGRVYQVDKSKQTKTMNAYVNGLGPTQRIVLWDTLLEKLNDREILSVMGHEMGHYVMHHLWKGLAFGYGVMFVVMLLAQRAIESGTKRWGPKWGFDAPSDPAAVPWLLVVLSVAMFLLSPVFSGFSRHIEHQADVFGLELTHMNGPTASAFIKFAENSKVDPEPPKFIEWWTYSHPSLAERIEFSLHYHPWEKRE
ncbi:MAG: M48 family metallopeptidase [Thermoanaerobaculia bacterium]